MKKPTDLGTNRTGAQASPLDSKKTAEGAVSSQLVDPGDAGALAEERTLWANDAAPVGTIPPPLSVTGMVKSAVEVIKGNVPTVLLDKIGERLAFERTGVRLYEALLSKLAAAELHEGGPTAAEVMRIRDDELRHFLDLKDGMEMLGADPTAMTPCADVVAVASSGVLKVLTDPRTTLSQCLESLLMVELMDNDAWATLATLAEGYGKSDLAERFRRDLADEVQHLEMVRRWVNLGTMGQAGLAPTPPKDDHGRPATL